MMISGQGRRVDLIKIGGIRELLEILVVVCGAS
jgi:hypothetical protein